MTTINNNTQTVVAKGNKDANGEYLYTKQEDREKFNIKDASTGRTIEATIGLSAVFLTSKETGKFVKGSVRISFLKGAITYPVLKRILTETDIGKKVLEHAELMLNGSTRKNWCEYQNGAVTIMAEGPNTREWGEGVPTLQKIKIRQNGVVYDENIRIYINNVPMFLDSNIKGMPEITYDPEKVTITKEKIESR